MRIINEFQYYDKIFRAGELTVWDYYLFIRDPQYAIQKILSEFNEEQPELEEKFVKRFLRVLFDTKDEDVIKSLWKKKKENPLMEKDFHILIGSFARLTNLDPLNMPLSIFLKMRNDLKIIWWSEEYKADRNDTTVDKKWLYEAFPNLHKEQQWQTP